MCLAVCEHLYFNSKQGSKKFAFNNQRWTYRDVLTAKLQLEIHQLALKLSGDVSGSQKYLASYSVARYRIEKKLSDRQHTKYKVMANKWLDKKLPQDMQHQYIYGNDASTQLTNFYTSMMKKHGPRAIREFTLSSYKQFGMHVVILAAYVDDKEDLTMAL